MNLYKQTHKIFQIPCEEEFDSLFSLAGDHPRKVQNSKISATVQEAPHLVVKSIRIL